MCWPTSKHECAFRACGDAQAAAEAAIRIHPADIIGDRECPKVTPIETGAATGAGLTINCGLEIGSCDRTPNPELDKAAQHTATAGAAIANVVNPALMILSGMDQSCLFSFVKDAQGFFLGYLAGNLAVVECTLDGRK